MTVNVGTHSVLLGAVGENADLRTRLPLRLPLLCVGSGVGGLACLIFPEYVYCHVGCLPWRDRTGLAGLGAPELSLQPPLAGTAGASGLPSILPTVWAVGVHVTHPQCWTSSCPGGSCSTQTRHQTTYPPSSFFSILHARWKRAELPIGNTALSQQRCARNPPINI